MAGDRVAAAVGALCAVLRGERVDWAPAGEMSFWETLVSAAAHHGVDALACHLLKGGPEWESLPTETREALLARLRQNGAIEMVRRHDLEALLGAFEAEGIVPLLLKGAALAYTHYPEPHLRSRVDTDLFIAMADIARVKAVFAAHGQRLAGRTYKSHQFHSVRTDLGAGNINYDVHWRSSNRARYARVLGYAEALRESVPVPGLAGARTLQPGHALLQACMHRAGNPAHDPDRLIWLYDIHLLASAMSPAELQDFAARAVRENLQGVCRDALERAAALLGTALGAAPLATLAAAARQESRRRRRLAESPLGLVLEDLRELPDLRSRAALVREYLAPPGDYLLARYGKASRVWVPWLYCRYLVSGTLDRLRLR